MNKSPEKDPNETIMQIVSGAEKGVVTAHKELDFTDLTIDQNEIFGTGGSAEVYKGCYKGEIVAVKIIDNRTLTEKKWEFLRRELAIMSLVSHPNVVHCIAANSSRNQPATYLILPAYKRGSLEDIKERNEMDGWTEKQIIPIAVGIACGMKYLSSLGIIHRDLKPANILLDDNNIPKITDYGRSRTITASHMTSGIGSPIYMAPELMRKDTRNYKYEVDIYSFGILLWELLTKQVPYANKLALKTCEFITEISEGKIPRPPLDNIAPALAGIIERCWDAVPSNRPDWNYVYTNLVSYCNNIK